MKRLLVPAIALFTALYCGIAVFDPSDSVAGMKPTVFAVILSLFLALIALDRVTVPRDLLLRVLCIAVAFPAVSMAVFVIRHPGQSIADGLSLAKALWAVALVLPVVALGIDLRRPVFLWTGLLALSTIGLGLGSIVDPTLQQRVSVFLIDHNVALIGSRSFAGLDLMMIFFVTSPLLAVPVPSLIAAIVGRRTGAGARIGATLFLLLIVAAAILSASRALLLVLLLESVACILVAVKRRPWLVAGTLLVAMACSVPALIALRRTSLFSAVERSNSVKIAHARSFIAHIDEQPTVLLTGDGLGASYFSAAPGVEQEVYQTELTYLDMVRYFGLAGSLCFLLLLIAPFGPPNGFILVGLSSYLVIAGSNPLLFNSTGMLAVVFFWSEQCRSRSGLARARGAVQPVPERAHAHPAILP
jgi:hypothetical protein